MTATWTAPRTWTAGEIVTAALLNQHLRDNLEWLAVRGLTPTSDLDGTVGNTSSSSFTDIGSSFEITTVKSNAVVLSVCWGTAVQGNTVDVYNVTLNFDGTNLGDSSRGCLELVGGTSHHHSFAILRIHTVASAGAHTLKLQARRSSGTSGSVTIEAMHLWAWELA